MQVFFGIYFFFLMLRLLMQVSRSDYYNPLCQAIVKVTNPVVMPLKPLLPSPLGIDLATLAAAVAVQIMAILLILVFIEEFYFHPHFFSWSALAVVATILDIYFYALIIQVVASWVAPQSSHPALVLVYQLTEPVCAPARRLLPPMGGLDFSIILVFFFIMVLDRYLLVQPLAEWLKAPRGLIFGI